MVINCSAIMSPRRDDETTICTFEVGNQAICGSILWFSFLQIQFPSLYYPHIELLKNF
uniref:Uncharacterized protein n=1 Tax=Meloidogyne incognita TaxID=6306 RepID=A0A914M576_MELIC